MHSNVTNQLARVCSRKCVTFSPHRHKQFGVCVVCPQRIPQILHTHHLYSLCAIHLWLNTRSSARLVSIRNPPTSCSSIVGLIVMSESMYASRRHLHMRAIVNSIQNETNKTRNRSEFYALPSALPRHAFLSFKTKTSTFIANFANVNAHTRAHAALLLFSSQAHTHTHTHTMKTAV